MHQPPLFVIGTGRCGSTLLSKILRANPDILSISELFAALEPNAFDHDVLDGPTFWHVLSWPRPRITYRLQNGLRNEEFLYNEGKYYSKENGVPPILTMTLPHLTDEPDALYEELREFVLQLPEDHLSAQYLKLFEFLRQRFEKKVWVERSGGSLRFLNKFMDMYPDAKFIHLYRDGRECAMSMSRHNPIRVGAIHEMIREEIQYDMFKDTIPAEVRERMGVMAGLLPDQFDIDTYNNFEVPIERFGRMWNDRIMEVIPLLETLPAERVLTMRYETLLQHPDVEIRRLMSFIFPDFDNEAWIEQTASMIRPLPAATWTRLSDEEQDRLQQACASGLSLLQYI